MHLAAYCRMVSLVTDILPGREAGLMVGSRQWTLLAARMQNIRESGSTHSVAGHLNRRTAETFWKHATGTALVGRLVDATLNAQTTPLTARPASASRLWVSPMAARSDAGVGADAALAVEVGRISMERINARYGTDLTREYVPRWTSAGWTVPPAPQKQLNETATRGDRVPAQKVSTPRPRG
ncbi:hypothetical protein ABZY81_43465 [Streptomyces sp. NPDC006514]|uniref:hypothetical protein n=1 Tax=Streptomyces sp. NPDC006514 TaxID=3154308 RepID=UPI0033A92A7A